MGCHDWVGRGEPVLVIGKVGVLSIGCSVSRSSLEVWRRKSRPKKLGGDMPRARWGKTIFWLVLLVAVPAIWRVLSGQTQRMNEAKLKNDVYQSCMDMVEHEYAAAVASKDTGGLAVFFEKYGVENISEKRNWSGVVHYADEHCLFISRKSNKASRP